MTNTFGEEIGSLEELIRRAATWEREAHIELKWGRPGRYEGMMKVAGRIFAEAMAKEAELFTK